MVYLNFIVEGETEEAFANEVLAPHLTALEIYPAASRVKPGPRKRGGGLTSYDGARAHIIRWTRQERGRDHFFTTMFDLYALPDSFPGYDQWREETDPYRRVEGLETAMKENINDS